MTILIHFHQSHYRDFKAYYTQHVSQHMRAEQLVSYYTRCESKMGPRTHDRLQSGRGAPLQKANRAKVPLIEIESP